MCPLRQNFYFSSSILEEHCDILSWPLLCLYPAKSGNFLVSWGIFARRDQGYRKGWHYWRWQMRSLPWQAKYSRTQNLGHGLSTFYARNTDQVLSVADVVLSVFWQRCLGAIHTSSMTPWKVVSCLLLVISISFPFVCLLGRKQSNTVCIW